MYNILLISNSLSPQTRLTFSDSPFRSLDLPHNLGIISLPFSSHCLRFETHLLSVKLQGFVVGDFGHDLVGFAGLIWWVLVVLNDSFDGVEIGVVGFG